MQSNNSTLIDFIIHHAFSPNTEFYYNNHESYSFCHIEYELEEFRFSNDRNMRELITSEIDRLKTKTGSDEFDRDGIRELLMVLFIYNGFILVETP